MAAWKHDNTKGWTDDIYLAYRKFAAALAPTFRGQHEDCADLSMMQLINFAASNGLPLTFVDNAGVRYISKAEGAILRFSVLGKRSILSDDSDFTWSTREKYTSVVQRKIGVEALWEHNTTENPKGPMPGDLMIAFHRKGGFLWATRHHAALVYTVYPAGSSHPKQNDKGVPDFPGPDDAMKQTNVTEYFKGTVDDDSGATVSRQPDGDVHFDYLNSRGDAKRNAELIYFANARQIADDNFEFRVYSSNVLDNWFDWDGSDVPPR